MKKKFVLIILVIILAASLGGCALLGINKVNQEPLPLINGTTTGNILNYGFSVKNGDELLFNYTSGDYYPLGSTVRSNPETGQSSLLMEDGGLYMNIVDGLLYYCNGEGVFRANIENPEPELVLNKYVRLLQIRDDIMYYIDDYTIDARTIDGEELEFEAIEHADCLNVYEDKLYYLNTDDGFLYKAELDGSNQKLVLKKSMSMFCIMDNDIYYLDATTGYLVRLAIDGKLAVAVVEHACSGFNINRSSIYYTRFVSGASTCCSTDVDGGNEQVMSEFDTSDWHLVCMFDSGALLAKIEEMPGI